MTNNTLNNILTFVIAIAVISATYIFVIPGFVTSETISTSIIESTTVEPTPKFSPVREPTEIESLINDIMLHNAGNKGAYSHNPDKANDVHVCMNMAVDQAIWISENYEYDVGIVLLHRRTLGDNHVQTSVVVNGTQYVIDSTSHYYWTADEHVSQWSGIYGIQYTTVEKGIELEKENNELLNNKNESFNTKSRGTLSDIISVKIYGDEELIIGEKGKFTIIVQQNDINTSYKLSVKVDNDVIFHRNIEQSDQISNITITHEFITCGPHIVSTRITHMNGNPVRSESTYDDMICIISDK